jgi:hypothetical protein
MSGNIAAVAVTVTRPWVTLEEYAKMCGVSKGVVYGWASSGLVKTRKIGKWVMINNMAESMEAAAQAEVDQVVFVGGE